MKTGFFKADIKRLLMGYKTYGAVVGVMIAMFFSLEQHGLQPSVLTSFSLAVTLSGLTLAYVFCILPYGLVFCEDMEHNYIRYQVIRGDLKSYVFSKVAVIYLSSMLTMLIGCSLFVVICRMRLPWFYDDFSDLENAMSGAYAQFLSGGHCYLYYMMRILQLGLLAGMLSVLSAFLSLYLSNKVMVTALPVCLYQFWVEFAPNEYISVHIFRTPVKLFPQDWQCFAYVFAISVLFTILCTLGILERLKRHSIL